MEYKKIKELLASIKASQEERISVNRDFMVKVLEEILARRRSNTAKIRKGLCPNK